MAAKGHEGQPVIVTGAGRGFGEGVAYAFAEAGAKVAVVDLVEERARRVAETIAGTGGEALALNCDVTVEAEVARMVELAAAAFGSIEVLANIAGGYTTSFRASHETPEEEWDFVVDSNLKGSFLCAKHVIPHMLQRGGGRIVNFASNAGRTSSPILGVAYTAAKAGVLGLTRHLAKEYGPHNILVNTIAPGPARGARADDLFGPETAARLVDDIPLGRLAEPGDLAPVVLFLASEGARFITGATIDVNGGYVMV